MSDLGLGVLRRLQASVATRIVRGVLKLVNDAPALQELQAALLRGEVADGLERFQQYGLTSHPHPDAEVLVLRLGAGADHGIVIAVDDRRYRLTGLEQGEVALYDDEGSYVKLRRGGLATVHAPNGLSLEGGTARIVLNDSGALIEGSSVLIDGAGTTIDVQAGSIAMD